MGKMLDHKVAGTFWSAPEPRKPFLRIYCPCRGDRLKNLFVFTSLEEWWLQGYWEICMVPCMVVSKSSSWRMSLTASSLGHIKTACSVTIILYVIPCRGVLRLDRTAVCHAMLGGLKEHTGTVTGLKKLSCRAGSEVFCLWSSQAKLLCKCTISAGAVALQANSPQCFSSFPVSIFRSVFFFHANFHCFSPTFYWIFVVSLLFPSCTLQYLLPSWPSTVTFVLAFAIFSWLHPQSLGWGL